MTRGVPVLDPERDLKGATPEKLARALFRTECQPFFVTSMFVPA